MNLDNPSDYKYDLFTSSLDKGKGLFDMVNKNLITSYFLRGQLIAANDYSYADRPCMGLGAERHRHH